TAQPSALDGSKVATVTASDVAGNLAVANVGSVTFDFTPPGLGSANAAPAAPGGCPLAAVGSETIGAGATLDFTVTEPLAADPVITVARGAWTVAKNASKSSGLFYEYQLALTAAAAPDQGAVTPRVTLLDGAGNGSAPLNLPPLVIDSQAPAAPD